MSAAAILIVVCLVLMGSALLLLRRSWQQARLEQVAARLGALQPEFISRGAGKGLERLLLRAGLQVTPLRMRQVLLAWASVMLLGLLLGGWVVLLLLAGCSLLLGRVYLAWRYRRRLRRMVQQLPQMLDQVVRSLQTGRTLSDAMLRAIEASPDSLRSAMARLQRNVQLGVPLADALADVAELYEQQELRMLALGVRVNHLYGGSTIELLGNLIKVIHEREILARQLRAMTGETRLTAVVLAVLPAGMAGYMLMMNPQYLLSMWLDDSGRWMLVIAFVMQMLGCLAIWRMLRSI